MSKAADEVQKRILLTTLRRRVMAAINKQTESAEHCNYEELRKNVESTVAGFAKEYPMVEFKLTPKGEYDWSLDLRIKRHE